MKKIEIFIICVILFVLAAVCGCDDEPVYGYVMSEIHFWDETCQKEIVGPTIQPACYFLCNTCSNIWAVDPNRNVRILDAYELFEFCKKYRKEFEFDEKYMREKFSVYDTTMTDMIDKVEVNAGKELIHEQEVEIVMFEEGGIYYIDKTKPLPDINVEGVTMIFLEPNHPFLQGMAVVEAKEPINIYFDDAVDTNAEGYKGDGSSWKNAINDLDLIN